VEPVLRHSDATLSAALWRRGAAVCIIAGALAALAVPAAVADRAATTGPNPEQLWRAYPLEQTSTSGTGTSASPPDSGRGAGASSPVTDGRAPRSGPPWITILVLVAVSAVLVLVLVALGRRRRSESATRGAHSAVDGAPRAAAAHAEPKAAAIPTGPGSWTAEQPPAEGRRAPRARTGRSQPVKLPPPANGAVPQEGARPRVAATAPSRRRESSPALPLPAPPPSATPEGRTVPARGQPPVDPTAAAGGRVAPGGGRTRREKPRSTGPRSGPVCQIRWLPSRRGSCFRAVTVDAEGVERTLALSPRFSWSGPSPPEQSPEAQAALRRLAKQLRDKGWQPMRAKGTDFNEQRWYARRFRLRPPEPRPEDTSTVANEQGRP
jgi:hypothetical protein